MPSTSFTSQTQTPHGASKAGSRNIQYSGRGSTEQHFESRSYQCNIPETQNLCKRGTPHNPPESGNTHSQQQLSTQRSQQIHHKPLRVLSVITNENIVHVSQAMDTPGVSGNLSQIIPPFTQNINSTSILQGTYNLSNIDPRPEICQFLQAMASHQS